MRDYLIIARVGDKSLHPRWLEGDRNWDLALSSFGSAPVAHAGECVLVEKVKGPKWAPLHDLIVRNAELIDRYKYVMLPDDDLLFTPDGMSWFFDLCRRHDFAVAQPSLDYESFYSHPITIRRPMLSYRLTDFVEVMTPCFRTDVLHQVLPTFVASASGWGIDDVWPGLVGRTGGRMAIVDEVSVTHTRPVGGELYKGNVLVRTPSNDYDELHGSGRAAVGRRVVHGRTRGGLRVPRPMVKALGLFTRFNRRRDGGATWTAPTKAGELAARSSS